MSEDRACSGCGTPLESSRLERLCPTCEAGRMARSRTPGWQLYVLLFALFATVVFGSCAAYGDSRLRASLHAPSRVAAAQQREGETWATVGRVGVGLSAIGGLSLGALVLVRRMRRT